LNRVTLRDHAARLGRQLAILNVARKPEQMDFPGWGLHVLKGDLVDHWAVWVNANWRLTFRFVGEDAEVVDYPDYH
jgi:proteic killer suppression protein